MKMIPIQVVWREGNKNLEAVGAVHAGDIGLILPTSKEDEVTMYTTLCPGGITVRGSVIYYVSLIEDALDDGEFEVEMEEEDEGLEDGLDDS